MSKRRFESIKTIAVVNLKTDRLTGYGGDSTCPITELSIYAFSATNLRGVSMFGKCVTANMGVQNPPDLPRVLHKITMMSNPGRPMDPESAKISGLTNEMLSHEAPFDKDAANCLLMFFDHLQKPICLVAHNGWAFDYPILDYVFRKINVTMPSSIYCVDSLNAFRELDHPFNKTCSGNATKEYDIGSIYERVFEKEATVLHRAEADVLILTQLVLYYGSVFLSYVDQHMRSFDDAPQH